jgi:integral membrane protein
MLTLLRRFERNTIFTESEAWGLFRLSAIGEACGWSLLISGIILRSIFHTNDPVIIAGQIHGMLFFCYAAASLGLYPNLRWSRKKAFIALLASVPPYGSLLFEQWASYKRDQTELSRYRDCLIFQAALGRIDDSGIY